MSPFYIIILCCYLITSISTTTDEQSQRRKKDLKNDNVQANVLPLRLYMMNPEIIPQFQSKLIRQPSQNLLLLPTPNLNDDSFQWPSHLLSRIAFYFDIEDIPWIILHEFPLLFDSVTNPNNLNHSTLSVIDEAVTWWLEHVNLFVTSPEQQALIKSVLSDSSMVTAKSTDSAYSSNDDTTVNNNNINTLLECWLSIGNNTNNTKDFALTVPCTPTLFGLMLDLFEMEWRETFDLEMERQKSLSNQFTYFTPKIHQIHHGRLRDKYENAMTSFLDLIRRQIIFETEDLSPSLFHQHLWDIMEYYLICRRWMYPLRIVNWINHWNHKFESSEDGMDGGAMMIVVVLALDDDTVDSFGDEVWSLLSDLKMPFKAFSVDKGTKSDRFIFTKMEINTTMIRPFDQRRYVVEGPEDVENMQTEACKDSVGSQRLSDLTTSSKNVGTKSTSSGNMETVCIYKLKAKQPNSTTEFIQFLRTKSPNDLYLLPLPGHTINFGDDMRIWIYFNVDDMVFASFQDFLNILRDSRGPKLSKLAQDLKHWFDDKSFWFRRVPIPKTPKDRNKRNDRNLRRLIQMALNDTNHRFQSKTASQKQMYSLLEGAFLNKKEGLVKFSKLEDAFILDPDVLHLSTHFLSSLLLKVFCSQLYSFNALVRKEFVRWMVPEYLSKKPQFGPMLKKLIDLGVELNRIHLVLNQRKIKNVPSKKMQILFDDSCASLSWSLCGVRVAEHLQKWKMDGVAGNVHIVLFTEFDHRPLRDMLLLMPQKVGKGPGKYFTVKTFNVKINEDKSGKADGERFIVSEMKSKGKHQDDREEEYKKLGSFLGIWYARALVAFVVTLLQCTLVLGLRKLTEVTE